MFDLYHWTCFDANNSLILPVSSESPNYVSSRHKSYFLLSNYRKLRDSLVTRVHNHLGVNLLLSYVVFLAAVERPRNRTGCIIVAAFIQYFLLNAWGWMSVECYIMYM